MKNFFETIKDMLYDSIDYIIMIGIIGIVVFVIGWRLDLLFAKDALDVPPKNDVILEDNKDKEPEDSPADIEEPNDQAGNDESEDDTKDDESVETPPEDSNDSVNEPSDKIVKITIPAGSLPSKIGSILESNGLVSSRADFVQKAQELKLDTKLKSGDYEIKANSTLEEIIKLLSK